MNRLTATEKVVIGLEVFVGLSAVVGGVLLMIRPNGSLLSAKTSALARTPFRDYLIPGLLLALIGGVGTLPAAVMLVQRRRYAREIVLVSGAGMMVAEAVEGIMIGFQPLQPIVGLIGLVVLALGWRIPAPHRRAGGRQRGPGKREGRRGPRC